MVEEIILETEEDLFLDDWSSRILAQLHQTLQSGQTRIWKFRPNRKDMVELFVEQTGKQQKLECQEHQMIKVMTTILQKHTTLANIQFCKN